METYSSDEDSDKEPSNKDDYGPKPTIEVENSTIPEVIDV
jgi:hypothetical protein